MGLGKKDFDFCHVVFHLVFHFFVERVMKTLTLTMMTALTSEVTLTSQVTLTSHLLTSFCSFQGWIRLQTSFLLVPTPPLNLILILSSVKLAFSVS